MMRCAAWTASISREGDLFTATDEDAPAGDHYYRLRVLTAEGATLVLGPVSAHVGEIAGIEDGIAIHPNPSPGPATIDFEVGNADPVELTDRTPGKHNYRIFSARPPADGRRFSAARVLPC